MVALQRRQFGVRSNGRAFARVRPIGAGFYCSNMSSWPSSYTGNTSNGTQRFSSAFVDQTGPLYGHETATSGTSVTGADSSRPQKRKRISLACVGCKARKVRCDKKIPCEQCIKRGEESFCKPDQPFDAQGRDLSASNVQQKKSSPSSADSLAQVGNSFPPPEGQQNNIDVASPPVWPASALEDLASLRARVSTLEQALVQQMPSITPLLQKHHKSLSTERFGLSQNIKPVTSTKGGEGDLSSEDAAQVLEDLAINGAPSSTNTFTAGSSPQSQSNQLYPSIAVSPMYSSLQRSVMELLFPKIPPDQNLREAVELYLKEVGWIFPVIIEP